MRYSTEKELFVFFCFIFKYGAGVVYRLFLFFAFCIFLHGQEFDKNDILHAQKIIGIEFTDAERDSMLNDLKDQIKNYSVIRQMNLKNSVMPSLLFNPIPAGFKINTRPDAVSFSDYSAAKLPEDKNQLAWMTIGELAHLIKSKQITSVELTKFFIERLKKYDPVLHCVITLTEERAMKEAARADDEISSGIYKGLLHGIPYGVKDLLSTEDYKTTWGAEPYTGQMFGEDATVIKKIEAAGAVLTAKLTMGALAWGDVWFGGRTRNPWDTASGSSGSSAGSASSVAAGLLPFAIGTETYGSIVSPSTICGTTGLRPTYGRVSRYGAMALSWSMDKIGPITRGVEDLAIVFNAIYGQDDLDPTVYDYPFSYSPDADVKSIRVGYLKSDLEKNYPFKKYDSLVLMQLRDAGIELIPIELPEFPIGDISLMLSAEAAAAFDELTLSDRDDMLTRQIKNAWPNVFRSARFIPAVEYINASRARTILIQKMHEAVKDIDVYIAPSWQGRNLLLTNLTGHPSIVVPTGFSDSGTPVSITFCAGLFQEGQLLQFAKFWQDMNDHHKKHPEMFK